LRSTTQLVEIDTVATDAHGKPVTDLKSSEFRVYEDGVERTLSHFSYENVQPIDAQAEKRFHDLARTKRPGVYANFTPDTAMVPPNGCTVLLIDWLNTPRELQSSAQHELKKFLETVNLSKPLAIYSLDSSLHQVQSFTSNRQVLRDNIERYGQHTPNLQPQKQADNSLHSQTTDFRVRSSAAALLNIASAIGWMNGHKSVIWLSGAFPAGLMPTNRKGLKYEMEANQGGWLFGERRNYSDTISQVSHVLSAANIAVYPVDATGLQGNMADASQDSIQYSLNPITQDIMERQQAMRDVADLTGGRAFYNHNDIGDEVATAYEDANSFYALAFTPARNKPDGKVHALRVECSRPGVHLRYRKSYFAEDRQVLVQMKRFELESLVRTLGQPADGLVLMAAIDKQHNDRLKLWLDGNSLSVLGGQNPALNVDVGIATFDVHGNLLQQNYADMNIKITSSQLHEIQASGLSQILQFARSKESARVRIAVRDLTSGRIGTLEVPLQ
jgi:VWFA-related protein